jgi:hypothetical protein
VGEAGYYRPIKTALENGFAKERGFHSSDFVIEICGNRRRGNEGTWSVPDITLYACQTLKYIPGKILSLFSFEVKTKDNVGLTAVYEALAHTRFVNFSYLVVVGDPQEWTSNKDGPYSQISAECFRHGIGLIIGDGKPSWDAYETVREGERFSPDFSRQDQYVARAFDEDGQEKINRLVR